MMKIYSLPIDKSAYYIVDYIKNKFHKKITHLISETDIHNSKASDLIDEINKKIAKNSPFLIFNGSGKFHHLTYYIVRALNARNFPFTYIHIDAHMDYKHPETIEELKYNNFCGKIQTDCINCKKLIFLGSAWKIGLLQNLDQLPRIQVYVDNRDEKSGFKLKKPLRPFDVEKKLREKILMKKIYTIFEDRSINYYIKWPKINEFDPKTIPTKNVYVSIDLDAIEHGIITDYKEIRFPLFRKTNEGKLSLEDVIKIIKSINSSNHILGIDICGLSSHQRRKELKNSLINIAKLFDEIQSIIG